MCLSRSSLVAATVFAAVAGPVSAAHVDVLVYEDQGGLSTGYVDVDTAQTQLGTQLFSQTLTTVLPSLYGVTAPGFYSNSSYPLLASSDLGFDLYPVQPTDGGQALNLLYWDGQGAVDFTAPPSQTSLQFRLSSSTNATVAGTPDQVPGFVLEGSSPAGILHKHISYAVYGPNNSQPADGLYLTSLRLTMPGLDDSDTVYFLFNAHYQRDNQDNIVMLGDQPQVDPGSIGLAEAWIEQHLINDALEGDLNGDGFVGVDDLNIVLVNWNQSVTPGDLGSGDPTGEGFVGVDDLNIVLVNWNNGTPPVGNAVPEPATVLFTGLMTAGVLCRRGRRAL